MWANKVAATLKGNSAIGKMIAELERRNKFYQLSRELFQYHHKRRFFKSLHEELIAIAWNPDRWQDWCLCEEERKEIEKLW